MGQPGPAMTSVIFVPPQYDTIQELSLLMETYHTIWKTQTCHYILTTL